MVVAYTGFSKSLVAAAAAAVVAEVVAAAAVAALGLGVYVKYLHFFYFPVE
jgi:hypothetical protein